MAGSLDCQFGDGRGRSCQRANFFGAVDFYCEAAFSFHSPCPSFLPPFLIDAESGEKKIPVFLQTRFFLQRRARQTADALHQPLTRPPKRISVSIKLTVTSQVGKE